MLKKKKVAFLGDKCDASEKIRQARRNAAFTLKRNSYRKFVSAASFLTGVKFNSQCLSKKGVYKHDTPDVSGRSYCQVFSLIAA